jgi:hypothetical protein
MTGSRRRQSSMRTHRDHLPHAPSPPAEGAAVPALKDRARADGFLVMTAFPGRRSAAQLSATVPVLAAVARYWFIP